MRTRGLAATDVGLRREGNEDAYLSSDELGLYAVCDGMGGHAAGEVASRTAIGALEREVRARAELLGSIAREETSARNLATAAREVVEVVCAEVHALAMRDPDKSGMGCTLSFLLFAGARMVMAHVGDTRVYLHRDGAVEQLSTDHTMAHELVRGGAMSLDAARGHRLSHVLTRSVGQQPSVEPDLLLIDAQPDDTFLLCSDGLTDHLTGLGELAEPLAAESLEPVPGALVALANGRGGHDNVTVVVVRVDADGVSSPGLVSSTTNQRLITLQTAGLCRGLPFTQTLRVLHAARIRPFDAGEVLVERGTLVSAIRVVSSGSVVLEPSSGETLGPGAVLGEATVLAPRACRSALVGASPGELIVIEADALLELARRRPWLGVELLARLGAAVSGEVAVVGERVLATGAIPLAPSHLF